MTETKTTRSILPSHIEETVRLIAELHANHHQNATPAQRLTNRLAGVLARPAVMVVLTIVVLGWIGANVLAAPFGFNAIDPPPFQWVAMIASLLSLYLVVLILASQRHADELAQYRAQLTLELALLSQQKTTKVIQLLEEARRDNPFVRDRVDPEAESLAQPADVQTVFEAIKETHAEAEQTDGAAEP
jgi:uncharacterized membrane protein